MDFLGKWFMILLFINNGFSDDFRTRNKRSIIYPTGSIFQLSLGLGLNPNVQDTIININFGFQQNVPLPTNITQLEQPPTARKSRDMGTSQLYEVVERLLQSNGYNGTQCLLKSICQMATMNVHDDGVFESVLHHLLSPNQHTEDSSNDDGSIKYHDAHSNGKNGFDCDTLYTYCGNSPIEQLFVST